MPDPKHLERLKSGVEKWNLWRFVHPGIRPNLFRANLSDANLAYANFGRTDLSGADLSGANLSRANLRAANLSDADLTGASLTHGDLSGANLLGAKLSEVNLSGADLANSDLTDSDLSGGNLSGADCSDAKLLSSILLGTDLSGAVLSRSDLLGTRVQEANFSGVKLFDTQFHGVDLSGARRLETVRHLGPSRVSGQTLEMSRGQTPDAFLKGCGFPDWAIESAKLYNPNLRRDEVIDLTYRIADMRTEAPIVPRSIFISYSNKDMDFVEKLESRFDEDWIRSWRDVKDLVAGPIEEQIDRAIGAQKVVLLVISRNSIRSDWVEWEVRRARELQKDLQEKAEGTVHVLCPVAIDRSWWERNPWPGRLRAQVEEYNIVDLSEWKDKDAFGRQYQTLKQGLGIYYRDEGV